MKKHNSSLMYALSKLKYRKKRSSLISDGEISEISVNEK